MPESGSGRYHAIDHLKAAAIVGVVFTHAPAVFTFEPPHQLTWRVALSGAWTEFQVPAFMFASGFLYALSAAGRPVSLRTIGRRLSRVLVPYLLASLIVEVAGLSPARNLREALVEILTANANGIYYYVMVILLCIPTVWLWSRMRPAAVALVWVGCAALEVGNCLDPFLLPTGGLDWRIAVRDPLHHFWLGFFLTGWLAACWLPTLARLREREGVVLALLCAVVIAAGWLYYGGWRPVNLKTLPRIPYTFAVVGAVALATRSRPAGAVVRFLSEASLGLYLYHWIPQHLTQRFTRPWGEPWHILAEVAIGLGGASLFLLAGRRVLGPERARRFLGA